MRRTSSKRLIAASVLGILVSTVFVAVIAGYLGLVVLGALLTGASLVGVLLEAFFPWVVLIGLLLVTALISALGIGYGAVRAVSFPSSVRLEALFRVLERRNSDLRKLGLSERFAPDRPSPQERARDELESVKRRYVEGEIDEREFERRLDRMAADESLDDAIVAEEREEAREEREPEYA